MRVRETMKVSEDEHGDGDECESKVRGNGARVSGDEDEGYHSVMKKSMI